MNKLYIATLLLFIALPSLAQNEFSLFGIIEKAQENSPRAKQAETRKENRYWQYRFFKSNYNPQLVLSGALPGINRSVIDVTQPDGSLRSLPTQTTNGNLNLGLRQPITLTGGEIAINTGIGRNTSILPDADGESFFKNWNPNIFNLSLSQPLFAFNTLKWDKKIEPIRFEESKREYAEEVELISRTSVELFFDYLDAQVNLQVAKFNQLNNNKIYDIENNRYNIGTTSKDKLLQVELQKLRSEQDVESANLAIQSARFELNRFTGLTNNDFSLVLPEEIPSFEISTEKALEYARNNRSDYLALERRRLEANRDVSRAKKQRFQIDLNASFGRNNTGNTFIESLRDPTNSQRVNIGLNVPLVTWGRNEASLKIAQANKVLEDYTIEQDEINFDQEVITLVSRIDVLNIQLKIAKKSDEVAQQRYNIALSRYEIGKIDITNLNIALQEKDNAKRSYLSALRDYWRAYFDLRRLTLYDFTNKQLLYKVE